MRKLFLTWSLPSLSSSWYMGMKSMGAPGSCMLVMPHDRNSRSVFASPSFISSRVITGSCAMRSSTGLAPSSLRLPRGSPVSGSRSI